MSSRLILCGLIAGFGPLGSHMIVPVLEEIARSFDIGLAEVQLGISAYLVCLASGQFVMGALVDRIGARRVLIGGMAGLALSCGTVAFAPSFPLFIVGRAGQGLCGSTGMVLALALIGRSEVSQATQQSGYLLAWLSSTTVLAPVLGGGLAEAFGWRMIFLGTSGLAVAAGLIAWVGFHTPPPVCDLTARDALPPFRPNARLLVYTAHVAIAAGSFYFFIGILPYATGRMFHFSAAETGLWLFIVSLGLPLGALAAGVVRRWSVPQIGVLAGAAGMTCATAIPALALHLTGDLAAALLFLSISGMACAQTVLISRAQVGAVSVDPGRSGTVAGIVGATQFAAGAVFAVLGGWITEGAESFAPALTTLCAICAGNLLLALAHRVLRPPDPKGE